MHYSLSKMFEIYEYCTIKATTFWDLRDKKKRSPFKVASMVRIASIITAHFSLQQSLLDPL